MSEQQHTTFDPRTFLSSPGFGRTILRFKPKQAIFNQGTPSDAVYYIQSGRARITVVSRQGREAVITFLGPGDFVGEESITSNPGLRMATCVTVAPAIVLRIDRAEMARAIREEPNFAAMFVSYLLTRSMRVQADLIDQIFNSTEKRLARILLLMAEFGDQSDDSSVRIPKITQQTLAEMVGTHRGYINEIMNRFRKHGFISYDGGICVHKSLLNVLLYDDSPPRTLHL